MAVLRPQRHDFQKKPARHRTAPPGRSHRTYKLETREAAASTPGSPSSLTRLGLQPNDPAARSLSARQAAGRQSPAGTHQKMTTLVAGLRHDGITAPFVVDAPMNGEIFLAYQEKCLVPTLSPGEIVSMGARTQSRRRARDDRSRRSNAVAASAIFSRPQSNRTVLRPTQGVQFPLSGIASEQSSKAFTQKSAEATSRTPDMVKLKGIRSNSFIEICCPAERLLRVFADAGTERRGEPASFPRRSRRAVRRRDRSRDMVSRRACARAAGLLSNSSTRV